MLKAKVFWSGGGMTQLEKQINEWLKDIVAGEIVNVVATDNYVIFTYEAGEP